MKKFNKVICTLLASVMTVANVGMFAMPIAAAGTTPTDGNIYYLKNVNSGLYLQVEDDSAKSGANVCQATGTGSTGQKWIVNDNGDGSVRLKSALDMTGGLALDVVNGSTDDLTNIRIWESNGLSAQDFILKDNGDNAYSINTAVSDGDSCLDVTGWSADSGANVCEYQSYMAANQLWVFENASWPSAGSETTTEETETTTVQAKATSSTSTSSNTQSWNMGNSSFKNLGTISENVEVDGMTLVANSSKTMSVKKGSASVNGTDYNYMLALGGSGSTKYRAMKIAASGASTLKVIAESSGSSARTLMVTDKNGNELGTISAGKDASLESISFDYSGDVYIYSKSSGINVFKVQLDSKNSGETTTKKETTTTTTTKKETTTETTTKATTTKETTTQATTSSTNTASSKSWNISNSAFRNLGTISSNVTVDGLTFGATSAKTMSVVKSDATVGSNSYTYALSLGGGGSKSYRNVSLAISGTTNIKVTCASTGSSARTLAVVDSKGNELGTISAGTTAAVGSVATNYSGTVYIYSKGSGINIYKVQIDTTGSTNVDTTTATTTKKETTTETTTKATTTKETTTQTTTSASTNTGSSKTVSNFNDLVSAVKSLASTNGGGTVYVNAKSVDCTAQLALSSTKGNPVKIVGVKQSDGTYPILDFKSFRSSMVGSSAGSLKASSDSAVGVRITGSNYTLENLIIQKAGDNGIQIKGANANYNTVKNCIVRYNNDAGVQITAGASYNTMRFVYSYRNCDVYTLGGNSDGFAPKLGATTGNTFYGCYAWDNSDDGWDSFDKTDGSGSTKDLSYEECACWNNGNPETFTGKYDFDNGNSLDTDMFLIELICKEDSSFASNFKKGTFSLPSSNFIKTEDGNLSPAKWASSNYAGNDNGFKFGSVNTKSSCNRTVKNCLSFGHGSKGFDNNNSSCTATFENCISYDNKYNYYVPPFTINKWSNINGFNGKSADKLPSGFKATTPSTSKQSSIRSEVNSTVKNIVNKCNSDIIPGEVYFNIYN